MGQVDIVSASAGSGKTYSMAYRYILTLIEQPTRYRNLLAVTFTNKATDELKQRILQQLNLLARGENEDFEGKLMHDLGLDSHTVRSRAAESRNYILHDYNNFSILTIDKFFQRVMRAFIKELGIDLNFNLELQTENLLGQAADRMLDELATDNQLRHWVMDFIGEKIEEGTTWNIKGNLTTLGKELFEEEYRNSAITTSDKPELLKIIAQAKAIAKRQADTFRSLGNQWVEIVSREGLLASDFKGGSRSFANYLHKVAAGIIENPSATVIKAAENPSEWYTAKSPQKDRIKALTPQLQPILQQIVELYPATANATNTASLLSANFREFALLADLRSRIDALCKQDSILPISDVNDLITKLIADNDAPFIYEKVGNRFSHFMIDEFQDTSRGQWNNFVPLLHNAVAQEEGSPVMLVGDVKQSIYRWRGGDWSLLARDVSRTFDQVNQSSLLENYRSREQLVRFNNFLIAHCVDHLQKGIDALIPNDSELLSAQLAAQLTNTPNEAYSDYNQEPHDTSGGGYVTVLDYPRHPKLHPVISRIEDLQSRGFRAKDIAILVRTNPEAKQIAKLLLNHKAQNPTSPYIYDIVTQDALELSSSPDVRFVVALLALSINPSDTLSRATLNNHFGRPFEQPLSEQEADFVRSLSLIQPEEAFNQIMLHYGDLFAPSALPYLQALHNAIIAFCSRKIADTALWLEWWNENGYKKPIVLPQEADAITIATIHKSKGLGYQAVILPYCNWSMTPKSNDIYWAVPNKPLSANITKFPLPFSAKMGRSIFSESYYQEMTMSHIDSLNTLYVAITRAKSELHIMVPTKPQSTSVGAMVMSALKEVEYTTKEVAVEGADKVAEEKLYQFGSPAPVTPKQGELKATPQASSFATYSPAGKIAVSYNHQLYDTESRGDGLSPREYGTLLHSAFEQATTVDDIFTVINSAVLDGNITPTEGEVLRQSVERMVSTHSEVAEWFDGSWERVLNEREIIDSGQIYRPDRVMIRGQEAVVVDYKFGLKDGDTYERQIANYARLLTQMGYRKVSGYLWYITTEKVVKVV